MIEKHDTMMSAPPVRTTLSPVGPVLTLQGSGERAKPGKAKVLVFEDPTSRAILQRIERVAPSEATVLIVGETGTGKEIVARHLHQLSRRASRPFVAVNCGALTETLVDSELFGHDRGAFTGATAARDGWFEAAEGGTLFLDEIGDLPLAVQVKLLRVLQEREVVRLGSRQPTAIDVRLIAATNLNLREAVAAGRFREDLYYRLSVAPLRLPGLRERTGDILPLAEHFLAHYRRRLDLGEVALTEAASEALLAHAWPGNIRELENVVHHALLVCQGGRIVPGDLHLLSSELDPVPSRTSEPSRTPETVEPRATGSDMALLERALGELFERNLPDLHARVEETLVRAAYGHCHHNQVKAAQLLGVSRNIFRARLLRYGLLPGARRETDLVPTEERPYTDGLEPK